MRNGLRVACRPGTSDWTVAHEMYLAGSYSMALRYLTGCRGAGVVLDLGANIGCFSLLCANLNPDLRVIAYEPEPSNVSIFETNLRLNPTVAGRIALVPAAVTGVDGTVTLNISANVAGTNIIPGHVDSSTRHIEIPTVAFSRMVTNLADAIRLVKMDIEGSEFSVIESTPPELWNRIPAIAMEIHEDHDLNMHRDRLLRDLETFGYIVEDDALGSYFLRRRELPTPLTFCRTSNPLCDA